MGLEMLDLSSSIEVLLFPVGVPGLGGVDPAPSNLPVIGLDNANTTFSSSYPPPPLPPLAYTPLRYPPPVLEVTPYQVLYLSCLLFRI